MRDLKLLNLGLHNAMDKAYAPEGSLTKTQNCRYRPGSITLWQAEGRAQAGTSGGIGSIVGLAWDPPYGPELIYWDGGNFRRWKAATSHTADSFLDTLSFSNVADGAESSGPLHFEIVVVPGGALILDGSKPKYVSRITAEVYGHSEGETSIALAGIRTFEGFKTRAIPGSGVSQGIPINASTTSGTSDLSPQRGYTYWAVFRNNPVSTASTTLPGDSLIYGTPGRGGCGTGGVATTVVADPAGTGVNGDIRLLINISVEEYEDNTWSYLAVYRNKDGTTTNPGGLTTTSIFPNGIEVGVIPKSASNWSRHWDGAQYYWQCDIKESQLAAASIYEDGLPYEFVAASAAGRTTGTSRDDAPPKRVSTGDVYLDCMLMNDLDNPRKVVYSFPGLYQQFPMGLYYLTFNSSENDQVSAIRSLGQVAIVLTTTACWRLSSLPTAADFDFSHGEVQTLLAESTGCPRPQAATKAHLPQPFGTVCCWVSARGIFATNGFDVVELTAHIDWKGMNVSLDKCNLVDDPINHRLVFHDGNDNLYYLHYHPTHITSGILAITGPILRPGGISHLFRFYTEGGIPQVASLDRVGHLFYEGVGNTDESTGDVVVMEAQTKEYYPGGIGAIGSVPKVFAHIAAIPTINGTYSILFEQGPDPDHLVLTPLDFVTRQLFTSSQNVFTETLTFIMTGSGAQDFGINAIGWDWDDHGTT